jgi:hypothetical protein
MDHAWTVLLPREKERERKEKFIAICNAMQILAFVMTVCPPFAFTQSATLLGAEFCRLFPPVDA